MDKEVRDVFLPSQNSKVGANNFFQNATKLELCRRAHFSNHDKGLVQLRLMDVEFEELGLTFDVIYGRSTTPGWLFIF